MYNDHFLRWRTLLLALVFSLWGLNAGAATSLVCFDYGCQKTAWVHLESRHLKVVSQLLASATNAESERHQLALAVAYLYKVAGQQTPIWQDQPGDLLDGEVEGRMDCIDHAHTTDGFLRYLAQQHLLRFHRVLPIAKRTRFLVTQHFAAVIHDISVDESSPAVTSAQELMTHNEYGVPLGVERPSAPYTAQHDHLSHRYVVDSWFGQHGEPPLIIPLRNWLDGEGPNVY